MLEVKNKFYFEPVLLKVLVVCWKSNKDLWLDRDDGFPDTSILMGRGSFLFVAFLYVGHYLGTSQSVVVHPMLVFYTPKPVYLLVFVFL